ncbi:glycosyltransferase family 4 protein [Pseudarthrobacter sp. SSS035]|uniref:glycosyltransferase family 4 protein n=1 Tax=Pseudarthrobacter sp. SSS035 TaxID=2931399 RepID=UPI00200FEC0E|nr:glycosyltransferase family 4 protein [Pseudarthrobacter sp. SSS035]
MNQFAVPEGSPGGTRHVEMFSLLSHWESIFVVGDSNYFSGGAIETDDARFRIIKTRSKGKSPLRRALGWVEFSAKAIIECFDGRRVDIVYASSPHLLAPVAGWVVAKFKRARLIVEIRDLWPESFVALGAIRRGGITYRALRILEKWIYRRADWIVGVSERWRPYFEENAPGKGYSSIPNGTDVTAFDAAVPYEGVIGSGHEATSGLKFVFAGSHGPKDGLDLLLDVVADFPDDVFVLIGDGTDKAKITARVESERLTNVLLLPPVTKSELPRYLKLMDVGLHLVSDWDVFKKGMSPNKLHDYLGSGLPVVSNAEGEPHVILNESGAGFGVAPLEIASGLRLMKELAAEERAAMGKRGRSWMLENRSRTIVAKTLEDLLNTVAGKPSRG